MKTICHRVLSFLLHLIVLLSALPALPIGAMTETAEDTASIVSTEELFAYLSANEGAETLSLSSDLTLTIDEHKDILCRIEGTHTLDLNGYHLTVLTTASTAAGPVADDSLLFLVSSGASLTVTDSSEEMTGGISFTSEALSSPLYSSNSSLIRLTARHLFRVEEGASLSLIGGEYLAGEVHKQWIHRGITYRDDRFLYSTGFADYVTYGTTVTVETGGTLAVTGATLISHGSDRTASDPFNKGWEQRQPTSACIRASAFSKVTVNSGRFEGRAGADVFACDKDADTTVLSGEFLTTPAISERLSDLDGFAYLANGDAWGDVMLSLRYIPDLSKVFIFHGEGQLTELHATDTLRKSDGLPFIVRPSVGSDTEITAASLRDGTYTLGTDGSLTAVYAPQCTIDNRVTYEWYYSTEDGTVTALPFSLDNTLDLKKAIADGRLSLRPGHSYVFRCVITETQGTQAWTTLSSPFNVSISDTTLLPSVSLNVSSIGDNNIYIAGKQAPTFSPAKSAHYRLSETRWYRYGETEPLVGRPILTPYSRYFVVFTLTASDGYHFTDSTRITYIPGGTNATIAPSSDGTTATVTVHLTTGCEHTKTHTVVMSTYHMTLCATCGDLIAQGEHTFGPWQPEEEGVSPHFEEVPSPAEGENTDPSEPTQPPVPTFTENRFHRCTVCDYSESAPQYLPLNGKTVIGALRLRVSAPLVGKSAPRPVFGDTEYQSKVILQDHVWTTLSGEAVETFEANTRYRLTVLLRLKSNVDTCFDPITEVYLSYGTLIRQEISDDGTTMSVVFEVTPYTSPTIKITPPVVKTGASLLSAMPRFPGLGSLLVTWYRNGQSLGSYTLNGTTRTFVTDNTEDDIDFSKATFEEDGVYRCHVRWYNSDAKVYVDAEKVTLSSHTATETKMQGGTEGYYDFVFARFPNDDIIRTVELDGINPPTVGKAPDTSVALPKDAKYRIKTVSWNSDSTYLCTKEYSITVTLTANDDYRFASAEAVLATVNGYAATVSLDGTELTLTYTFAPIAHEFDHRHATLLPPLCTENGLVRVKCKNCEAIFKKELHGHDHVLISVPAAPSTCSTVGYREHLRCAVCFALFTTATDNMPTEKETLSLPIDSDAHRYSEELVHDGNHHYRICLDCGVQRTDEAEHRYGEPLTASDGTRYFHCSCGHEVAENGPKQPAFLVEGDETLTAPPSESEPPSENEGASASVLEKVKLLLLLLIVFLALLVIAILTLLILLILNRRQLAALPPASDTSSEQMQTSEEKEESTVL